MATPSSRRSGLRARATAAVISAVFCVGLLQGPCVPAAYALKHHGSASTEFGLASYYSRWFDGRETAGGEIFNNDEMVAAHPTYPLGTLVRVSRLDKPASTVVRVADRGPSIPNQKQGVIIDLSQAAANKLNMRRVGRAKVRVDVLKWGKHEKKPLVEQAKHTQDSDRIALR